MSHKFHSRATALILVWQFSSTQASAQCDRLSGLSRTICEAAKGRTGTTLSPQADRIASDAASRALGSILQNELPIRLDARVVYQTTAILPGDPFIPRSLEVTPQTLTQPLAAGDYVVPVIAFCTEYSVHRPGQGIVYTLGPLQGRSAEAVATLLWRGTLKGRSPQDLQAVAWGIQSGLTYKQLPTSYQATIDQLIPEYRNQLSGNFVQRIDDSYQSIARTNSRIPQLDTLLASMGKTGALALTAKRQQAVLLQQNTSDQIRTQTLFVGQNLTVVQPVRPQEGPWTVLPAGAGYARFRVVQGNMGTNTMELRILPQGSRQASLAGAYLVDVAQGGSIAASPSLLSIMGARSAATTPLERVTSTGTIAYSQGQGAQALIPIALPDTAHCQDAVAALSNLRIDPSDTSHLFLQNQTCIASAACNNKDTMDDPQWMDKVIVDFVRPFVGLTGSWKDIINACRESTNLDPLDPIDRAINRDKCATYMALYHITNDLQDALDNNGCGTQNDWDTLEREIGACLPSGFAGDTNFMFWRDIEGAAAKAVVIMARNSMRNTCLSFRQRK